MRDSKKRETKVITKGETVIGELLAKMIMLCPMAVYPHGRMDPLMRRLLYGTHTNGPLVFGKTRPNAEEMYRRLVTAPYPSGILVMTDIKLGDKTIRGRYIIWGIIYSTNTG